MIKSQTFCGSPSPPAKPILFQTKHVDFLGMVLNSTNQTALSNPTQCMIHAREALISPEMEFLCFKSMCPNVPPTHHSWGEGWVVSFMLKSV